MEPWEGAYSQALNELAPIITACCRRSVGFQASNKDPRITAAWLAHRLDNHLRAFALLLNAGLVRDAEGVERSALEAAICLEGLRAGPDKFMDDLRKDAASTIQGQIPIWRTLDAQLADDATAHKENIFGPDKQPRLNLAKLAEGASNPMLYRRYKHLSANSVHITGLSLTSDGGDLFGLSKIKGKRRRDTIAWMTYAAFAGGSAFSTVMDYPDLLGGLNRIMETLENALSDLGGVDLDD